MASILQYVDHRSKCEVETTSLSYLRNKPKSTYVSTSSFLNT